jgi:hypothetical protein
VPKAVLTDPKGEYTIRSVEKVDSITFSFLGYRLRSIHLKRGGVQQLNIEMGSDELKLTEITVKAGKKRKHIVDTVANYVFYQVLKNKEQNRSTGLNSYKYNSYEKLQISLLNPPAKFLNYWLFKPFRFAFENKDTTAEGNTFIPGLVKEIYSEVYYRKNPKSVKKFIQADRMSGVDDPSVGNLANYHFAEIDPYENLFVLASSSFVSPFAPTGTVTYFYYLTDTLREAGRTSYKLHFVGKVKEDLALKGFTWIDSATWAIKSITFRPNEKANLNFINDYTIKQEYELVNNKHWLMKREEMNTIGSLFKKKNKMAILVTKILDRKDFVTDVALPDSVFAGPEEKILADSARNRNEAYWDSVRFEKLTKQEKRVFVISDTIKLVRAWKTYEWLGRFFTTAYADAGPISFGRVLNFASRNNVEGWRVRLGFETNPRFRHKGDPVHEFFHKFYFTGYGAYGFKDKDFKYLALSRINLPRRNDKWQSLEVMYRYDMRVPGQDENQTLLTFDNVVTLISGHTLSKIMKVREFQISYEKEWLRGFSTIASMNEKTYYDIPGVFDFSRKVNEVVHHIPHFNVTEFMIDSRYSYNDQYFSSAFYRYFQTTKYPVLMLRYTAGVVDMQGDYFNYHNFQFTLRQRLSSPIGHTSYIFRAGKILGRAPYTACYLTQGNLGVLLDKFNYNLLREFEFVTDQYASLWVEHHFDGFFLNKIPGVNKLRLREVIFVKSLIGTFSKKNDAVLQKPADLSSPFPYPYVELGFGIENIAYLFRVDFLWRATYRHNGGQNWGIKFVFQPGF